MLRAESIAKHYRATPVLRGVSLEVAAGEFVALVGRSGSGKSSLLHILGGLDRTYEGGVELFGERITGLSDERLSRLRNERLGFVFQAFHLLDHLTVEENVWLPALWQGTTLTVGERARRVAEVLERVHLPSSSSAFPQELSGGQRQRVAIARALFSQPKLLFADEPTGNLDGETGDHIIALFTELHRQGLTLFVVTHEERVSKVASRVLHLADGSLTA